MKTTLHVMEATELSPEDVAEIERLMAAGDDKQLAEMMERMMREAKAVRDIEDDANEIVIRLAHELMHAGEHELCEALLCVTVSERDGKEVPPEVMVALKVKLIDFRTRWEKAGCGGNA